VPLLSIEHALDVLAGWCVARIGAMLLHQLGIGWVGRVVDSLVLWLLIGIYRCLLLLVRVQGGCKLLLYRRWE